MSVKKRPTGRPTKYREEYGPQLVEHMKQGFSFESFSAVIKVNPDTLYEWAKVHPIFSEHKKEAFAACQYHWEKIGMEGMYMGTKENPFQSAMWIFSMKARFKWADKTEIEQTNKNISVNIDSDDNEL